MTSELGWFKMAGVGGMLENTSSQDSEDTSDRRFSPRSQACRKFTTFSDGFIHEKIVPGVDKSPKSLKVVRMNGVAGSSPKPVQPLMSKPVLRSRSEKPCQESQVKKKRSNSQTLVEEGPRENEMKHDAMVEGQPQHPATPPTSPKSPEAVNYSGIKRTSIASPVKNSPPLTDHCLTSKSGTTSEPLSPPVLPKPLAVNGVAKPPAINGACLGPTHKDTFNKCLIVQPKKNGLQLFTNLNAKDGCFGPPPISPDISRSCTPPASTSSGNSCRDDASSKDSTRSTETTCQWFQCGVNVEETDLMDHIRLKHVEPQLKKAAELSGAAHERNSGKDQGKFVCLWTDCKVYNRKSCSRTWLERHVVSHAGDKPFKCIVDGCGQRFTSEGALQRHVNSHFNTSIQNSDNCKTVKHKDDTPSKQTKKKKLRRKRSWLIKTDDYFDSRTMEHIQQSLLRLSRWTHIDVSGDPNSVTLHSTVVARRTETSGKVQLLLRWKPESILPDQWVMESQLSSHLTRSVPMHALPHDSTVCLETQVYRQHRYRKHRRK